MPTSNFEKCKDAHHGRHPADHQQFQEEAEDTGKDQSGATKASQGIQNQTTRSALERPPPAARGLFSIKTEGIETSNQACEEC